MTWPTDDLSTTHFDAASDSPASARPVLKRLIEIVKTLIGARASADGVCELDANAKVPPARIRRGEAGGTAPLDANAKVPTANLPAISPPDATTAVKGIVRLATTDETTAGIDTARAATPNGVKAAIDAFTDADNETRYTGSGSSSRLTGYSLEKALRSGVVTIVFVTHRQRYTPSPPSPPPSPPEMGMS